MPTLLPEEEAECKVKRPLLVSADFPLILASGSPRRRQLLAAAGVPLELHPSPLDEEPIKRAWTERGGRPEDLVMSLAYGKAEVVARRYPDRIVLGADTIVVSPDGQVLGKPKDLEEAHEMLRSLSGRRHQVLTGVAVFNGPAGLKKNFSVASWVTFRTLTDEEIEEYHRLVSPLDRAGAYSLQDEGCRIVEKVEGSRTNVIGLPMEETLSQLQR